MSEKININLPKKIGEPVTRVFMIDDESFFACGKDGLRIDNELGQPIDFYNFNYEFPEYGVTVVRKFGKYFIGNTEVTEDVAYEKLEECLIKRQQGNIKPPQPGESDA